MTKEDFYELVKKMRLAQKEYFSNRCPSNLNRAKSLEHEVDKAVKDWEFANSPQQASLM